MPRRKRSSGPSERRRKVRRRGEDNNNNNDEEEEEEDTALIISDSEHDEEEEDCPLKVTSRAARRQDREKTHMQDMTEEEMLDLALRLSEQEANSASRREQVEDADMRKAIAESLQVSGISETCSKQTRSAAKPHQDRGTVTAHVRCKLSFSNKLEKDAGSDEDVSEAQTSLPPMPDLSQKTSSQPSPPSPTLPSVPSAASHESHSSLLVKQEVTAHTPDSSQSDSAIKMSPVFLRDCSVRLNPNLLSASGSSKNLPHTNDSSLGLTSPEGAESSPPAPKSPVFPKTDSKRCTKLSRGTFTDCTSHSSFTDNVRKPEDVLGGSSSHKKGDSPKSSSHGRKAPGTSHVPAPEDFVKLRQVKDEGEGALSIVPDRAPDLNVSSPTDSKSLDEFTSHMVLHLSDDDEEDEENDKIIPPSPVFPQDRSSHAGQTKLSPTQPCTSSSPPKNSTFQNKSNSQASEQTKALRKSADFKLTPTGKDEGLVSYYWGVPFCPKGQSPDDYTRVILTQLEVYEKSLKEAQRQLLHKVDWGLPVFPCPIERAHSRRLKRHRAPQLLEEEEDERDEEEREKQKKMDESQPRSEEEAEDGQRETYVVVSSPETEFGQKSPSAFGQPEPSNSAKPSSCRRPVSQEHFEDTQIRPEADENGEEVQNEGFDAESAVCPETQMSEDNTPELMVTSPTQPQMQAETDVMEVDELTEPPAEPEERMEQERPGEEQSWRESVPSQVECPMCSRLFPLCEIEMHAAYCNGSVEEQDHDHTQDQQENLSQGIARRKSVRRTAMEDDVRFEKLEQREKCFICEKFIVTKEYTQHVDQCIRQKSLGHKQGNGLLSALNRTETVHLDDSGAGPSNTAVKNNRSHSDASAMPADSQAPAYSVSTSPFKSFTPISEIKDCLIDFRQQHTDRTSQRLGRKRKFKR